jgi:hypothetical protein
MKNKIIIFDLDGTLADIRHRRHFVEAPGNPTIAMASGWKPDWDAFHKACVDDVPNKPIIILYWMIREYFIDKLTSFTSAKAGIEIWSGRDEVVRTETQKWLNDNNIIYHNLRMRPHGDHRPDVELKRQWLNEVGKENVLMVFDDRQRLVDMWREEGLTCLQVAEGKF